MSRVYVFACVTLVLLAAVIGWRVHNHVGSRPAAVPALGQAPAQASSVPNHTLGTAPTSDIPFTLTRTIGVCEQCKTARELYEVHFTSINEAWAVAGYSNRPTANGAGAEGEAYWENVIVHSLDGGQTWAELPFTHGTNAAPIVSFYDPMHGWVTGWRKSGEPIIFRTIDGGGHWEELSHEYLHTVRFFDEQRGVGLSLDNFLSTSDGGRTWRKPKLPLPLGIYPYRLSFFNPQLGWIGVLAADPIILRTSDGGDNWNQAVIHAGGIGIEQRDLYFVDAKIGWAVDRMNKDEGEMRLPVSTMLFRTKDGGETWSPDADQSFQREGILLEGVRALGTRLIFAFGHKTGGGSNNQGVLFYSTDVGEHWHRYDMPPWLNDCEQSEGDLVCSELADDLGLRFVRIHPQP